MSTKKKRKWETEFLWSREIGNELLQIKGETLPVILHKDGTLGAGIDRNDWRSESCKDTGFEKIIFRYKGKIYSEYVHYLLAFAYLRNMNPHGFTGVRHKNGIITENYISNLEWYQESDGIDEHPKIRETKAKCVWYRYMIDRRSIQNIIKEFHLFKFNEKNVRDILTTYEHEFMDEWKVKRTFEEKKKFLRPIILHYILDEMISEAFESKDNPKVKPKIPPMSKYIRIKGGGADEIDKYGKNVWDEVKKKLKSDISPMRELEPLEVNDFLRTASLQEILAILIVPKEKK